VEAGRRTHRLTRSRASAGPKPELVGRVCDRGASRTHPFLFRGSISSRRMYGFSKMRPPVPSECGLVRSNGQRMMRRSASSRP
jgi:hypothetical protein